MRPLGCAPVLLEPIGGGGGVMPDYRVYVIGSDGHFRSSVALVCPDDETAKNEARELIDGHDVELWQYARKVATFKSGNDGREFERE